MKKGLMMLGVAAIALASCTQNEVMEVAESRAIGFNTFVGNTTKAIMTDEAFREFSVFGGYDDELMNVFGENKEGDNVGQSVTSTNGTTWTYSPTKYWTPEKDYTFQAYSPSTANGEPSAKGVNIKGFTADGQTDLLVSNVASMNGSDADPISLTFRHILSLIQFKFSTTINGAEITISDLKVNGLPNTGDYTNAGTNGTWAPTSGTGVYNLTVADKVTIKNAQTSTYAMILPQNPKDLTVTFKVNATGSVLIQDATHTVKLPDLLLTEGNQYTYTAEITAQNIDPENPLEEIVFGDPTVNPWNPETSGGNVSFE